MKDRFEVVMTQGFADVHHSQMKIIRDKKTGVLYVYHQDWNSGGLTVLVDKDGKPATSL